RRRAEALRAPDRHDRRRRRLSLAQATQPQPRREAPNRAARVEPGPSTARQSDRRPRRRQLPLTLTYRLAFTDSLTRAFRPRGAEARWNSEGVPVIYTAEHPALAALEILNAWQQYSDLTGYSLYLCRLDPDAIINAAPELKALSVDVRDLRA